jgi:hypothetical protein
MGDSLRDKLRKIKELAERGTTHERQTAAKMLERLLIKYSISMEDLIASEPKLYQFSFSRKLDLTLLVHIIGKVKMTDQVEVRRFKGKQKNSVWVELTPAERAEVVLLLRTYKKALRKEEEKLLDAFVIVNQIFNTNQSAKQPELTRDEIQQLDATLRMAQGISPVRIPRKNRMLKANNSKRRKVENDNNT